MVNFEQIANSLGIEEATLRAVCEVESNGHPFLSDGRPKILFEAHKFYEQLEKNGMDADKVAQTNPSICSKKWNRKLYAGGSKEYERLKLAASIYEEGALKSASWGMFQIMGFNYSLCGCNDVFEFVEKMKSTEGMIITFVSFCKNTKLIPYLQNKDWAGFARRYNGKSYAKNKYDVKLAQAYKKYSK